MYKATRPLEYICFFPAKFPTLVNGDVYVFIFVNVYSEFVIMTSLLLSPVKQNLVILS